MQSLPKNSWQDRDRIGGLQAFFQNIVEALINPFDYFERVDIRNDYHEPLILCFYNSLFLCWPFFKHLGSLPHFGGFVVIVISVPLMMLVISWVIKMVMARFGEHAGLRKSFFVLTFSSPAFIWALVPVVGYWLAAGAVFTLGWIGLVTVHNISFRKILATAWLIPALTLMPLGTFKIIESWRTENPLIDPEKQAVQTLLTLGTLAEKYAQEHNGRYPTGTEEVANNPCGKVSNGYRINCDFRNYGYNVTALPEGWEGWGLKAFRVRTGVVLTEIQR